MTDITIVCRREHAYVFGDNLKAERWIAKNLFTSNRHAVITKEAVEDMVKIFEEEGFEVEVK